MLGSRTVGNGSPRRASAQALLKPRPRIPAEHVVSIREAVEIVTFIGKNVPLRRYGKIFVGRCPWHVSKSGKSFNVDPIAGTWRCWGCSIGGDAFAFAERFFGIDFREAVQLLAREAGINVNAPIPAAVAENQRRRAEQAAIDASFAEAEKEILLQTRDALHAANRLRRRGIDRLTAIEDGSKEKFAGEAAAAQEAAALASRDARKLDAAYLILAFGSTADRRQFVTDPSSRDSLIDQAIRRGYIIDDRGHRFEAGL